MSQKDAVFTGSVPELYERYFVPIIFEPYALDLARRVAARSPSRILETAAGTGVVTRALAQALPNAEIVATDLNEAMIERARARLADPRVSWRQADAGMLPFEDGSFDVVCCQFGAMFFPDKVGAYAEARRVLKAGGALLFNVWNALSRNDFAAVTMRSLNEQFPDDPPSFMARTPHGYHDHEQIRSDLSAAGFTSIVIEVVEAVSRAPSARDAAIAYCQANPMRAEIEARGSLAAATEAVAAALAARFGPGPVEGRIEASVIVAM